MKLEKMKKFRHHCKSIYQVKDPLQTLLQGHLVKILQTPDQNEVLFHQITTMIYHT